MSEFSTGEGQPVSKINILRQKSSDLIRSLMPIKDFVVSKERAEEYMQLDRSRELYQGQFRDIPIGQNSLVRYNHEHSGHITDRPASDYESQLFSDQFIYPTSEERDKKSAVYGDGWSWQKHMARGLKRADGSTILYDGIDGAFKAGKKVLDLGSGEAIGIMQFSLDYPETTFIGVDTGYVNGGKLSLSKPGLQLIKDDWSSLKSIPTNSIDTVLSIQGAFVWGAHTEEDTKRVVRAISRVSKSGAILRFEHYFGEANKKVREMHFSVLEESGWKIDVFEWSVIAKKT